MDLYGALQYQSQGRNMMEQREGSVGGKEELVFPYIYGSLAFSLGKKGDSYTHRWICYVRGVNNQDLSYLLKKVVFKLHSSFQNPVRSEILKPPFEIQEVGWGQFEIQIQLHFNHPDMPLIELPHMLRLHHTHSSGSQQSKKPLCSECYDEVVFTQKDEHLEKILHDKDTMETHLMHSQSQQPNEEGEGGTQLDQPLKSITQYSQHYSVIDPNDHRSRLEDATRFIKGEISSLEEKMRIADLDIQKVYEDIYSKTS